MDKETQNNYYDTPKVEFVKQELNKLIWSYAPESMTLKQADEISLTCLHSIFPDLVQNG